MDECQKHFAEQKKVIRNRYYIVVATGEINPKLKEIRRLKLWEY